MQTNDEIINFNYTGFKVIEIFYDKSELDINRRKKIKCLCDCGIEFITRLDGAKSKKGCRSCGTKYGGKNRILPEFEAAKRNYYSSYKGNAVARDLIFNLTRDDFDNLISQNCSYCGMSPQDQSYLSKSTKKYDKFYASGIDRINNELGYELNNCVPCCKKCNMMKVTMDVNEFTNHILAIYEYQKYNVNNIIEGKWQ